MKKLSFLLLLVLLATTSISCSNDESATAAPVTPIATDGFKWTDNTSTTEQTVNNPYVNGQYFSIFGTNTGTSGGTVFEINLSAITVATYDLAATPNALYYKTAAMSASFVPTSGSVVITANANNKLSGTFTALGSGGGVTSVSGSFTNIVIN